MYSILILTTNCIQQYKMARSTCFCELFNTLQDSKCSKTFKSQGSSHFQFGGGGGFPKWGHNVATILWTPVSMCRLNSWTPHLCSVLSVQAPYAQSLLGLSRINLYQLSWIHFFILWKLSQSIYFSSNLKVEIAASADWGASMKHALILQWGTSTQMQNLLMP